MVPSPTFKAGHCEESDPLGPKCALMEIYAIYLMSQLQEAILNRSPVSTITVTMTRDHLDMEAGSENGSVALETCQNCSECSETFHKQLNVIPVLGSQ